MEWWVGSGTGREREGVWKERSRLPHQPASQPAQPPQNRAMKHGQQSRPGEVSSFTTFFIECPQWHSSRIPHKRTHTHATTTDFAPIPHSLTSCLANECRGKNDRPLADDDSPKTLLPFRNSGVSRPLPGHLRFCCRQEVCSFPATRVCEKNLNAFFSRALPLPSHGHFLWCCPSLARAIIITRVMIEHTGLCRPSALPLCE